MKACVQVFKFYNLGSALERDQIIRCIENVELEEVEEYCFSPEVTEPEFISYPRPIAFSPLRSFSWGGMELNIQGKVYTYGALSLKVKVPLEVEDDGIEKIVDILENQDLENRVEQILDQIYGQIAEELDKNRDGQFITSFNHIYQVFCLSETGYSNVAKLVEDNQHELSSLLSGIYHSREFSEDYINNVLYHQIRLYREDFSIIHWNNALLIDNQGEFADKLFIIELANIQFIKLQTYDKYIDDYLSEYLEDSRNSFKGWLFQFVPGVQNKLGEITRIRVELEEMTDIMDNFEKFFGRWYLAKIYYLASNAFEIKRWRRLVSSRMSTLNELYSLLNEESNRKQMLFLNVLMLLLFVLWFVTG